MRVRLAVVAVVDLGALERQQPDDGCQASLFGFCDALVPGAFLGGEADRDGLGAVHAFGARRMAVLLAVWAIQVQLRNEKIHRSAHCC